MRKIIISIIIVSAFLIFFQINNRIFISTKNIINNNIDNILTEKAINYKNLTKIDYDFEIGYEINMAELTDFITKISDRVSEDLFNKKIAQYYSIYHELFYLTSVAFEESKLFENEDIEVSITDSVKMNRQGIIFLTFTDEIHRIKINVYDTVSDETLKTLEYEISFSYLFEDRQPQYVIKYMEELFMTKDVQPEKMIVNYNDGGLFSTEKRIDF